MFGFEVVGRDGAARAGVLTTAHGDVPTPTFMAVGTAGTVKAMTADAVRGDGGEDRAGQHVSLDAAADGGAVARLGGLHKMMDWPGRF